MSVLNAVTRSVAALEAETDAAAVELALTYALEIDAGGDLTKLGPLLLAALEALGLTPRARASLKGGAPDDDVPNPLDQLRAKRAARQHDSAAGDAPAP